MDQQLPARKQQNNRANHTLPRFLNRNRSMLVLALFITGSVFGLETPLFAQSNPQSPPQNVPRRKRAPDISASRNIDRDAKNRVADVIITGNPNLPAHYITRNISTRPGRFFDPDLLQQDVDALWRMPEIRRVNGPYIKNTPKGVVVTIEVVERSVIKTVEFLGNRGISDRHLKKETGLDDGQPLDSHAIRMAKTKIEELYRTKGFPRTQVEIVQGDKVADGKVVFLIHEDQKQKIWKVQFEGNKFVSGGRLQTMIKSKPAMMKIVGGLVQRSEIEQDVVRLTSYYRSFGFFNARIGRELSESNDGRWLTIRFIIDEGPRYRVRNVSFLGTTSYGKDDLLNMMELKPTSDEMPEFKVADMNKDVTKLRELYGSEGFVFAKVEAEPRFLEEPGLLDLVYKIDEGQQYRVGNIRVHIDGDYGITKREVVLNRLSLRPGDFINSTEIRNSERRLGGAKIFATAGPGSTGAAPKIVVRPPELNNLERFRRTANQGSSPDSIRR